MKLKKRAIIESLDSVANLYGKEMSGSGAMLGNALQLNRAAEAVMKSELQEATKDRDTWKAETDRIWKKPWKCLFIQWMWKMVK